MSKVRLGTIGWSYNFWIGPFYPNKTSSKSFLTYYSRQFNTVEVDSTFYRIPTKKTIQNWANQTPDDFLFALKFPSLITHIKRFRDCQADTDTFLERVELLGKKLGPLLIQLAPTFTSERFSFLSDYLKELPKQHRYVVEIRNESWINPTFFNLLKNTGIVLAWNDNPLMEKAKEVTGELVYFRWEGNRKIVKGKLGQVEVDKTSDLAKWNKELKSILNNIEFFGYFGKYYSGLPPYDIITLTSLINTQSN